MPVEVQDIQQAYKFALDATPRQERMFSSHVGGARFAYNWGIATTKEALDAYRAERDAGVEKPSTKIPGHFDLCKRWTAHKNDLANELHWVQENFVGTYQAALRDAATAWSNFFKSRSGKRAGRRMGIPRFKSKRRARRAFQVHGETLQVVDAHHVKLPKIGTVKTHESTRKLFRRLRKNTAKIVRGNVSQSSDGRWHISLTVTVQREVRTAPSARQRAGGPVGVDIGVREIATLSNGDTIRNPRPFRAAQRKLRIAQRAHSRCAKDSKRREKARRRVGRIHARIASVRLDAQQKTSSWLIHNHSVIAVEGWNIAETIRTGSRALPAKLRRNRNQALADSGLGALRWQLQSKAVWYGATVVVTAQAQPTGRTCSQCGAVKDKPVPPYQDTFTCSCGHAADRRHNTARVLAKIAREPETATNDAPSTEESKNARGGDVRPTTPRRSRQSPMKREARTRHRRDQTGSPGP